MTQHYIAFAQSAWSWHPSTGHSALEQLVCGGWMIQEGYRPHPTESGRIKHQEKVGVNFEHYIVRELVLGDYDKEIRRGLTLEGPLHDLLESVK